jgi:uncharacterized caspase-like protein/outer membrane lipoprotein-sorting protein
VEYAGELSSPVARLAPDPLLGPRAALVVATGTYTDPTLTQLEAPTRNAEQMAAVLGDPGIGAFEVTQVIDRGQREIREQAEGFLAGRRPGDLVVVYLSCHGLLDARDRLYFAAADTSQERLAATGVESGWLLDRLDECRAASQVVILDCCFSGAFARGAKGAADPDLRLQQRFVAHGRGRAILTASRAWEGGHADGVTGPSVFTRALAEGLRTGAADTDGDGYISVDDAFGYAYDEVIASGARQTPQRNITGGEGILWLARSPADPGRPRGAPAILDERPRPAWAAAGPADRAGTVDDQPRPALPRGRWKITRTQALGAAAGTAALLAGLIILNALTAHAVRTPGPKAADTPSAKAVSTPSADAVRVYSGYGFDGPSAIAADGAHIWVVNPGSNSVTDLNASDGSLLKTLSAASYGFSNPDAIASDGTHVWVANSGSNSVTELNASDGSRVQTLAGPSYHFYDPDTIASDGTHVWIGNSDSDWVTELNAGDGSLARTMTGDSDGFYSPDAFAADGTDVWIASYTGNSVTELNADDGSLIRILSAPSYGFNNPAAIAVDGTHVWVANYFGDSVTELNAGDGSLVQTLSAHNYGFGLPAAIAADGTHIWVANKNGNSVTELPAG